MWLLSLLVETGFQCWPLDLHLANHVLHFLEDEYDKEWRRLLCQDTLKTELLDGVHKSMVVFLSRRRRSEAAADLRIPFSMASREWRVEPQRSTESPAVSEHVLHRSDTRGSPFPSATAKR